MRSKLVIHMNAPDEFAMLQAGHRDIFLQSVAKMPVEIVFCYLNNLFDDGHSPVEKQYTRLVDVIVGRLIYDIGGLEVARNCGRDSMLYKALSSITATFLNAIINLKDVELLSDYELQFTFK